MTKTRRDGKAISNFNVEIYGYCVCDVHNEADISRLAVGGNQPLKNQAVERHVREVKANAVKHGPERSTDVVLGKKEGAGKDDKEAYKND